MERILVVAVNWLGDALMMTPALPAIKDKYPFSSVSVMCVERLNEVFADNPYVDEVILFDEKRGHKTLQAKVQFIRWLKKKKFDCVFLVHKSFTRAAVCFLSGIPKRVGYKRFKNTFVLTDKVDVSPKDIHRQDYYLALFEKSEIAIKNRSMQFFIPQQTREDMTVRLAGIKKENTLNLNPAEGNGTIRKIGLIGHGPTTTLANYNASDPDESGHEWKLLHYSDVLMPNGKVKDNTISLKFIWRVKFTN